MTTPPPTPSSGASWTPPARSSAAATASPSRSTAAPTHPSSARPASPPTPPSPGGADASSASSSLNPRAEVPVRKSALPATARATGSLRHHAARALLEDGHARDRCVKASALRHPALLIVPPAHHRAAPLSRQYPPIAPQQTKPMGRAPGPGATPGPSVRPVPVSSYGTVTGP